MAEINPQNEDPSPESVLLLRASYSPSLCLPCSLKMELEPAPGAVGQIHAKQCREGCLVLVVIVGGVGMALPPQPGEVTRRRPEETPRGTGVQRASEPLTLAAPVTVRRPRQL